MKKYFLSMLVMALFAMGFAASDEYETSSSSTSSQQSSGGTNEFTFERGKTYECDYYQRWDVIKGVLVKYKIQMFNDGTVKIWKYEDASRSSEPATRTSNIKVTEYEGSIEMFSESKFDVKERFYEINGKPLTPNEKVWIYIQVFPDGTIRNDGVNGKIDSRFRVK